MRDPSVPAPAPARRRFLQAMAAYEPDYATARLYLTTKWRDVWQPTGWGAEA